MKNLNVMREDKLLTPAGLINPEGIEEQFPVSSVSIGGSLNVHQEDNMNWLKRIWQRFFPPMPPGTVCVFCHKKEAITRLAKRPACKTCFDRETEW